MSPTPDDLRIATAFAARIVEAGQDHVRRVVMIGSRALGTARPDSDLDLVVLVEIAGTMRPWGLQEVDAERSRLQREVGMPPIRTDLWVRTTDQFEEGRTVIGGLEHLVEAEGVTVFSRALDRSPLVRRTPDQVRGDNVAAWLRNALGALEAAIQLENAEVIRGSGPLSGADPRPAARAAVERALNVVLVLHQVRASKHFGVQRMLAELTARDPATGGELHALLAAEVESAPVAHSVVGVVLRRLAVEPGMRPYLREAERRFARPSVLLRG